MTWRRWFIIAVVAMLSILAAAQTSSSKHSSKPAGDREQNSSPDPGAVADGVYRNPFFGFSYKLPYGWVDRTDVMRDSDEAGKSLLLLEAFERPPEAPGEGINSVVVIAAEKVSSYSGLKTAADYFAPITELAKSRGFEVESEPADFSVGAKHLVRGDFVKQKGGVAAHQTSLVDLAKGWVVSFTFIGESDNEVDQLIEKLSFGTTRRGPPGRNDAPARNQVKIPPLNR